MATEEKVIKAYKGFDQDLKCRGFQYEVGKTYKHDGNVVMCKSGFHAIPDDESPLNVFGFYPPAQSRYCEVECGGETVKDDCKVSCSEIKIGAEIGILGLVKAHVEWVKKNITNENNAEKGKPATAGDRGAATAGDRGAATAGKHGAATAGYGGAATAGNLGAATAGYGGAATAGNLGAATAGDLGAATAGYGGAATAGEYGAATAGYLGAATAGRYGAATTGKYGAATTGKYGAATAGKYGAATAGEYGAATSRGSASVGKNGMASVRGYDVKAKGGLGAVLVIVNENSDDYDIKEWKAEVVDGERIKADTWYKLVDGEFVECK